MRKYKTVDTMLIVCSLKVMKTYVRNIARKNAYYINKSKEWFIIPKVKNKYKL